MVRPTGTPWNEEVNQQALRTMARFDRLWGKFFRGHPFVKDDKDVTGAVEPPAGGGGTGSAFADHAPGVKTF